MATLPMMAQERKCGRYRIVWDTFLNLGYLNSFRISARNDRYWETDDQIRQVKHFMGCEVLS